MLWQVAEIIPKESWGCLCLEWTRGIIFDNIDSPNQNHSTEIHLFSLPWPVTCHRIQRYTVTRLFRSSRESELCWRFKRWADLQSRGQKPSERQKQSPFPFAFCFCLEVERIWDEECAPDAFRLAACISTSQIRASSWIHVCINLSDFTENILLTDTCTL